jgi:hypothetical protein
MYAITTNTTIVTSTSCLWAHVLYLACCGFQRVLPVSSSNKCDCHNKTKTLLKVVLNTNNIHFCVQVELWTTIVFLIICTSKDCRGCDRMVVGFTITYAISAYRH